MKNTLWLFGIIVLAVVMGFSFVSCDSGSGGGEPDYNSGIPSDAKLSSYGIDKSVIDGLVAAAKTRASVSYGGSEYKGWVEVVMKEEGVKLSMLMFFWQERTMKTYDAVKTKLESNPGVEFSPYGLDTFEDLMKDAMQLKGKMDFGAYDSYDKFCMVMMPTEDWRIDGDVVPKGFLCVTFVTWDY